MLRNVTAHRKIFLVEQQEASDISKDAKEQKGHLLELRSNLNKNFFFE